MSSSIADTCSGKDPRRPESSRRTCGEIAARFRPVEGGQSGVALRIDGGRSLRDRGRELARRTASPTSPGKRRACAAARSSARVESWSCARPGSASVRSCTTGVGEIEGDRMEVDERRSGRWRRTETKADCGRSRRRGAPASAAIRRAASTAPPRPPRPVSSPARWRRESGGGPREPSRCSSRRPAYGGRQQQGVLLDRELGHRVEVEEPHHLRAQPRTRRARARGGGGGGGVIGRPARRWLGERHLIGVRVQVGTRGPTLRFRIG